MEILEVAKGFYEKGWNKRDFEYLEKIIDPSYHPEWVLMPEKGSALVKKEINYLTTAIPDLKYEIMKLSQDNDTAWVWYRLKGTQTNNFFGFPPSNKIFSHDGAALLYFNSENKIHNQMGFYCFEDIFYQLGFAPYYWDLHKYLQNYKPEE